MEKVGVLLMNLGGPERIKDVGPFLYNLFSDPEIIRLPIPFFQKPLAWLISTLRSTKSQEAYLSIGGGSPLRRITEQQARELQSKLRESGLDATTYIAMRYWHPFTESAIADIKADGVDQVVVLPLYPHFSISTSGSSFRELKKLRDNTRSRGLGDVYKRQVVALSPLSLNLLCNSLACCSVIRLKGCLLYTSDAADD